MFVVYHGGQAMGVPRSAAQGPAGHEPAPAQQDGPVIGLMALATYLPEQLQDAAYIAEQSGIPEAVVREKLGIAKKHRAGPTDQTSAMAVRAAERALERAGVTPDELDLVLYSGSMHKDFYVWSAA